MYTHLSLSKSLSLSIYIYIYIYIYISLSLCISRSPRLSLSRARFPSFTSLRESLSTGYGLRFSTESYGSKWEKNGLPRIPTGILFSSCINLQKSPQREFMGECNLGILYSSSLLAHPADRCAPSLRAAVLHVYVCI